MKSPFPLQVTENGRLLREVVPITDPDELERVWQEGLKNAKAQQQPRSPYFSDDAVEWFKRSLDAAGLLDENGMVKR